MKLNNKKRIIIDDDIIVTTPGNIGDSLKDVIDEQHKDIETLKSNMKFIYSYGGVGGSGKGGSGGGGSAKEPKLYAELKNIETGESKQINLDINNTNPLVLPKPGAYRFYAKLSNSGGEKFFLKYATGSNSIDLARSITLSTEENNCETPDNSNMLTSNGSIKVRLQNSDGDILYNIEQRYIVEPHDFDISFMYLSNGNVTRYDSGNEHFLGDETRDPFINIDYKINLPQPSEIVVSYTIGDFVSEEIECTKSSDNIRIFLKDILKDGEPFLRDENVGTYKVSVNFGYKSAVVTESQSTKGEFNISLIPSSLFINITPSLNILYDSIEEIIDEMDEQTIPKRALNIGAYLTLYGKVYDGKVGSSYENYKIQYTGYNGTTDESDGSDGYDWTVANTGEDNVQEQKTGSGISFNFNSVGIKKLVLTTESNKTGRQYTVEKYIYVKNFDSLINWPETQFDYYFKVNDTPKYSVNGNNETTFPDDILGDSLFEQKFSYNPVELSHSAWMGNVGTNTDITTIISFGIQLSNINTEHSVILNIYSYENSIYKLYTDALFGPDGSDENKIFIPTEEYNSIDGTKYHLVQICRHKQGPNQYVDYLYIDGKLESCKHNVEQLPARISKIVLNNVNAAYNLINLQYYPSANLNIDAVVYRYWLAYKQRYVNTASGTEITEIEKQMLTIAEGNGFKFDGSNVILNKSTVETIAASVDIPTMMFDYTLGPEETYERFMEQMLTGYTAGNTSSFGNRNIRLWWCGGRAQTNEPKLTDLGEPEIGGLSGTWQFSFQGTSTMANRIKNFSLRLVTGGSSSGEEYDKILFSPKFIKGDSTTFLPEREWTIKADIADSAHANNTSVGKFVNTVCTKFNTNPENPSHPVNAYIKNTLEGFPILLFFRCNSDDQIYYFGVYNFNLGRTSYNNLGYNTDVADVYDHATESSPSDFAYSYARGVFNNNLAVGEIQENMGMFDFSQTSENLLFKGNQPKDNPHMFGADSKITGSPVSIAKGTLMNFVDQIAEAGTFCFNMVGKTFINPQADGGAFSNNVYKHKNSVTDPSYQMSYDSSGNIVWNRTDKYDISNLTNDSLLKAISYHLSDETTNSPTFDYTSGSEYYTICMAFGLVDSILKNMNIKSWNNRLCYCAFYDMDCAFGEDNSGKETVSYMAATDYWSSTKRNGVLQNVNIDYDYWDEVNGGKGFDFTSSFLLAVIKYAKPICNYISDLNNTQLNNYPQDFWAKLRGVNGELRNTDYFLDKYFKSGVHMIPEYLTSLNYKVKYLYTDDAGTPLANSEAFNGTRYAKVKNWLTKRFHFLDVMFNVQGLNESIRENIVIPSPTQENKNGVAANPDVVILQDAFADEEQDRSISSNTKIIDIYAPKNTPVIIYAGGTAMTYILPENTNDRQNPNKLEINTTQAQRTKVYGSKEFIDVSDVGVFFTTYRKIDSNKLENVIYDNAVVATQTGGFIIKSVSVRDIKLNIPTYSGTLTLTDNSDPLVGSSITSIDISTSGFTGTFSNFPNLRSMNISSVKSENGNISIMGNPLLTANHLSISGSSGTSLTTLNSLGIQDVTGDFNLRNTAIKELTITGVLDEHGKSVSEFSIDGDLALRSLTLRNMKSIYIRNCPNLETLKIWGSEDLSTGTDGSCESLIIDMSGYLNHKTYTPKLKTIISTGNDESHAVEGDFNLNTDTFKHLNYLTIQALENIETLQLPNNAVRVGTMRDCKNLAVIKTDGEKSKLILTGPNTFTECPKYWLRNDVSWNGNKKNYIQPEGYTKMDVDPSCTDLSGTFALSSLYSGDMFSMYNAKHFIENIVDNISNVSGRTSSAGRITTLARCFYNRRGITYNASAAYYDEDWGNKSPILSNFTSLNDISEMYFNIDVDVVTSKLLSLPGGSEYNKPENPLRWDAFVCRGDLDVSIDCFENISYRITSLNDLNITIYERDDSPTVHRYVPIKNTEDDRYNILNLFGIDPEDEHPVPLTNITNISSLNFNSDQYIDFSRFFEVLPNVTSIGNFLNVDVSKFNIEGLFKPCKNLTIVYNTLGSGNNNLPVNLWDLFNWEEETNRNIEQLFTSYDDNANSFNLNKWVSYTDFQRILAAIASYTKLTKLTNIFSNCIITGYAALQKPEIKFAEGTVLDKIKCINYLFTNMSSDRDDRGLSFGRNLFVQLPNVEKMRMTFSGVRFTEMLSMDFFARRNDIPNTKEVYLLTSGSNADLDSSYVKHILYTYDYIKNIVDLNNTFYNARFVSCNPWYDRNNDNVNIDENCIKTVSGVLVNDVKEYYTCDNIDYYTITYGNNLTTTVRCTDNIIRNDVSTPYSDITGTIYVKRGSNKYEGYVKVGGNYNIVFTNISGFASIYNKCTDVQDTDYRMFTIDRYNRGNYTKYMLSTPEIDDCYNNFTHYVKDISLDTPAGTTYLDAWQNHNLMQDYAEFYPSQGAIDESTQLADFIDSTKPAYNKPFVFKYNDCELYPTYCMLPPDILYACYATVDLTGTFSDINATGVIPRHFTSKCPGRSIPDLLRNTNVLPNVQYYYRDYGVYSLPTTLVNILNDIPAVEFNDYDVFNSDNEVVDRITFDRPTGGESYSDIAFVIYRNENGDLRRRSKNNKDRQKGQFVYAPSGYSTSIDIRNTFNFRYNIPPNIIISGEYDNEAELISRTNNPVDDEYGLNNYYTQYFIMMDDSAKWSDVSDARSPFIINGIDRDYCEDRGVRSYYIEQSSSVENAWTRKQELSESGGWYVNARQTFNSMLNLCGTTDEYTSCVNDNGCPINLDKQVKIDNFLEGNLVTFLNGRVFYKLLDVSQLTTSANKISASSYVISIPMIAKNIILPAFNNPLYDKNLVFINGNGSQTNEYNFYGFMFNDETNEATGSIYNYINELSRIVGQPYISIREGAKKYVHR